MCLLTFALGYLLLWWAVVCGWSVGMLSGLP
jgi:hypothetical protein